MNLAKKNSIVNAIIEAKKRAGKWYAPIPHICSKDVCDPWFLIAEGTLGGDIYVCDYQSVHHCTPNTCNETDYGVCRISGACYGPSGVSSYDASDSRTWNTQVMDAAADTAPPLGGRGHRVLNEKTNIKKIEAILVGILYGDKRADVNANQKKAALRKFKKQREIYIQSCVTRRMPINLIEIELLYWYQINTSEEIPIEPYDYHKLIYYKELANNLITQTIKLMDGHVPIYTIESVTIGMLYYMKTGYMYEGIEVIPRDDYLCYMLPPIRELNKLGFDKKHVTKGQHIITQMYTMGANRAIPIDELAMVLPEINADRELMRATRQKTTTTIQEK